MPPPGTEGRRIDHRRFGDEMLQPEILLASKIGVPELEFSRAMILEQLGPSGADRETVFDRLLAEILPPREPSQIQQPPGRGCS